MRAALLGIAAVVLASAVVGTAAGAQPVPRVGLNHFYLVPDSSTFAAIDASRFLRDTLGVFEARTTRRSDQTYTGVYWYGQTTYFEFLPPGSGGREAGHSGMAWGSDNAADSAAIRRALSTVPGDSAYAVMITRGYNGEQVPWFVQTALASASRTPELSTWVMNYAGDFLARWNGAQPPFGGASASRAAVLERYAAVVSQHDKRRRVPLADVTGLTVAVSEGTRARLLRECTALGIRVSATGCHADTFVLTLIPATASARGVVQIDLALRQAWSGPTVRRFGRSELRMETAQRAVWRFP